MNTPTRNPLMNDLTVNPTDTAVLQESGCLSQTYVGKRLGVPFSFDWMLEQVITFAYNVNSASTATSVGSAVVPEFIVPKITDTWCHTSWNAIPFFWATYTRRETQVKLIAVKCFTPVKLQFDVRHYVRRTTDSYDADPRGRRNYTSDVDFTNKRVHQININGVYPTAYKVATSKTGIYQDSEGSYLLNYNTTQYDLDAIIQVTQTLPLQRGMLYPDNFNLYFLYSFAGTKLTSISSPSLCITEPKNGYLYSRFFPAGYSYNASNLLTLTIQPTM